MLQMLDADDAILEQAMQTGAALKRARDEQKAARRPKVGHTNLICVALDDKLCSGWPQLFLESR